MSAKPYPVSRELLQKLDFEALGREMRSEEAYESTLKTARTLVRGSELTIVLVALKEGARLKEHHSSGAATALVIEGEIEFVCPDEEKTFELTSCQSVVFSSAINHSVTARKDTLLLVVFGQKDPVNLNG